VCCGNALLFFTHNKLSAGLDALVVIVLPIGTNVHGLKFGQGRWIFMGDKNP
jgi:hypothetical protein